MTWSCFMDTVQVVSQILTTAFAGFGVCVAYQTLLRTPTQEPEPTEPQITEKEAEIPTKVKIFETSKQTTWLEVTDKGLECHLDEKRSGEPGGHQWTFSKQQAKEILSKRDYRIYPSYKLRTGLFSIGQRRNWLYSKKLYPEPSLLEMELVRLLERASA